MGELETFRDHYRKMAKSEHRPECAHLIPEPDRLPWDLVYSSDGIPESLQWRGPKPPWSPAPCDCGLSDDERALFARLADEIDAHLSAGDDEPLWSAS